MPKRKPTNTILDAIEQMIMNDETKRNDVMLAQRITEAKIKMLAEHPFFGLLCAKITFAIDPDCQTACTDGKTIYFGEKFSSKLDSESLYFIIMHELMHIVAGHCFRSENLNNRMYNIAADIVVNSIILDELNLPEIYIDGNSIMHLAPDGKEGRLYTAEEVYDMLPITPMELASSSARIEDGKFFDDHSKWGSLENSTYEKEIWKQRVFEAGEIVKKFDNFGSVPQLAIRTIEEITDPTIDWRTVLNDFIQIDINDYSFSPPDKRFCESDFMLPDLNVAEEKMENVFIAVDTSGSIRNRELSKAINEIKGAIDQFNDRFCGWISYFDYNITEPQPFSDFKELSKIDILGGGGTNFEIIFEKAYERFNGDLSCIIVITDGCSRYPDESQARDVPVLWLLNNKLIDPPWGKVARMIDVK